MLHFPEMFPLGIFLFGNGFMWEILLRNFINCLRSHWRCENFIFGSF